MTLECDTEVVNLVLDIEIYVTNCAKDVLVSFKFSILSVPSNFKELLCRSHHLENACYRLFRSKETCQKKFGDGDQPSFQSLTNLFMKIGCWCP